VNYLTFDAGINFVKLPTIAPILSMSSIKIRTKDVIFDSIVSPSEVMRHARSGDYSAVISKN